MHNDSILWYSVQFSVIQVTEIQNNEVSISKIGQSDLQNDLNELILFMQTGNDLSDLHDKDYIMWCLAKIKGTKIWFSKVGQSHLYDCMT